MDARHRQWTDAEVALAADHQAEGLAQASPGQSEARASPRVMQVKAPAPSGRHNRSRIRRTECNIVRSETEANERFGRGIVTPLWG